VVLEELDLEVAFRHAEHRDLYPGRLGDPDDPRDLRLLIQPPPEELEPEQSAVELERAIEVRDGDPRVTRAGDRPRAHGG
jgi:hypothetical protein